MSQTQTQSKSWQKTKLGDFVVFNYGKGLPERDRVAGPYPVFGSAGVVDTNKDYLVEGPGIVVGRKGSIGEIYYTDKNYFPIDTVYYITKGEKYNLRFLYYLLKTMDFKSLNSDVAVPGLNRNTAYAQEVLLPPHPTQKQIADILSAYDDLIEDNTKRIKILEQIAQAIYKEMFTSPAEKKWEIVALRDVIESYTGGGWGKEKLCEDHSGPAYVIRGTDIPKATIGDVSTCPLRYHTPSNLRARVLQDGDLVFEVSGGSKGQPVGRSLLITSKLLDQFKQNVICASFCKLIRPNQNKISPFQLYEQILSWYANGVIEKYQVQSTGISNFRFESFIDEEKVILPPEKIREKFDHLVSPLFDEIYSFGNQNQNLRQARDLFLPKLVTGEIEVKS